LSPREIQYLKRWLKAGVAWPTTPKKADHSVSKLKAGNDRWAFQPIKLPDVLKVESICWKREPMDAWVVKRLVANNLTASPATDRSDHFPEVFYKVRNGATGYVSLNDVRYGATDQTHLKSGGNGRFGIRSRTGSTLV
jgi:hypothetical protein